MAGYLLGVDMGTGSTKGLLADPDGDVVAVSTREHRMSLPRPGWVEMDAEQDWWGDVVAVCRDLVDQAGATPIVGMTVSGLGPCLLMCDADAKPLRPAILYGIDMRATEEIFELTERYGEATLLERCGKHLSSQAVGPKLLWVRTHEPGVYEQTRRWYSSHSYVVARLTGEYVLDHVTASQCDPLYDLASNSWNEAWAQEIAPGLELPRLAWCSDVSGTVTEEAAEQTGLAEGTPVCTGSVDAWAEAFSAGARKPGDVMLMYGSTVFLVQALDAMSVRSGLWTTAGVMEGSYTMAAGMATSGSLTGWVQELTGGATFEQLIREAADTPPGADGLVVLPYFAGERSPIFDPQARGVIAGLTLRHGRGHLFRAVYEGIGFGLRQMLEQLADAAGPPSRLLAVGGGTQSALWTQIVSDITGQDQLVPAQTIGASYGAALLAAIGIGLQPAEADWSTVDQVVRPNAHRGALYDELFEIYTELYPATMSQVARLAAVQNASVDDVAPSVP